MKQRALPSSLDRGGCRKPIKGDCTCSSEFSQVQRLLGMQGRDASGAWPPEVVPPLVCFLPLKTLAEAGHLLSDSLPRFRQMSNLDAAIATG